MAKVDILTTLRPIPSRLAPQTQEQTNLSPLPEVHGRRNDETPTGEIMPLPSHVRAAHVTPDLVHPRDPESCRTRLHSHQDPRSPPLPAPSTQKGALCRLCRHLAQNQARVCWLPGLGQHTHKQGQTTVHTRATKKC